MHVLDGETVKKPAGLANKTILITRPREQAAELMKEIEDRGGRSVVFSTIRILDPDSWNACDDAIQKIGIYAGIVFTSVNGVKKFLQRCALKNVGLDTVAAASLYAVGEKTRQELERRGLSVRLVPERFSAGALSEVFSSMDIKGHRFLCPLGNLGRDDAARALRDRGALVDVVTVYTTSAAENGDAETIARQLAGGEIDVVTFASPSAAANFSKIIPPRDVTHNENRARIAVIGPTTQKAVLELGFPADIVAEHATAKGLVDAIEKYFG